MLMLSAIIMLLGKWIYGSIPFTSIDPSLLAVGCSL